MPRFEPLSQDHELPGWVVVATCACFLLSGAAGLVYEVVWTRALLTVFGATQYAVATVLAAFMGGLALGSAAGGRIADRVRRPLAVYGALEIAIAVAALAVAPALGLFDPVYRAAYRAAASGSALLPLLRFAVCGVVLLVPTTLMGATLPLLSRFVVRRSGDTGRRIGALYAVNTFGAVCGTAGAGFLLIPALGVHGALVAAAGTGTVVALAAITISLLVEDELEPGPAPPQGSPSSPPPAPGRTLVLLTYAGAGFLALAYQVMWTRALVFRFEILKNTTYAFSAMLTVFLVGLAAGSAAMSAVIRRQRRPFRLYGLLLMATGAAGALSLYVLLRAANGIGLPEMLQGGGRFVWGVEVANVFLRTAATIALPTFLMGALFPVAARLAVADPRAVGRGTGRLYAANTLGAIAGAAAAGFGLVPLIGLSSGLVVLGIGYVGLGIVVLAAEPAAPARERLRWAALAAAVAVCLMLAMPGPAPLQELARGERIVVDDAGDLAYIEGPLATASVVEDRIGDRTITIDNVQVAGTDRILLTDQLSLAHVPMLLHPDPQRVLTVGFGSGGASASYLLYDEARHVDCIEISPTVPRLAHTLRASNLGLLDAWDRHSSLAGRTFHDGRYRVILDDARSYLRFTDTRYDVIATDCTDLRYKSNANLYDVEYFELCRRRLTDDGLMVVWMPLGGMSEAVFACAMRTFAAVFPDATIWYMNNQPTHYLLLVAGREPLRIDLPRLLARAQRPVIAADLARVELAQPAKLLSCYLTDAPAVDASLAELTTALNTEDSPYLEFESPKFGYGDEPLLANLELLRRHRLSVAPLLDGTAGLRPEVDRIERFAAPVDEILAGHAHFRRLEMRDAARDYLAALARNPEDASLRQLLRFDDLRRRLAVDPGDLWALEMLAEVALEGGNAAAAEPVFAAVLASTAGSLEGPGRLLAVRSRLALAEAQLDLGRPAEAIATLDGGAALLAGDATAERLRAAATAALP